MKTVQMHLIIWTTLVRLTRYAMWGVLTATGLNPWLASGMKRVRIKEKQKKQSFSFRFSKIMLDSDYINIIVTPNNNNLLMI